MSYFIYILNIQFFLCNSHIIVEKDSSGESSIQIYSDPQKDMKDTNMQV
jgi:hypothetical protein